MAERVRIGTRGSVLALRQAELVAAGLRRAWPGLAVELVPIRTSGDRLARAHLAEIGGKGLFVKEIEDALLARRIEVAVHSLKDLPAALPDELVLAAFPERDDARDVLVSRAGGGLAGLPDGARVGTSSLRRKVQLVARRPDLRVEAIRGNVDTRLSKLEAGDCDAVVLAAAGLRRLGLAPAGAGVLDPEEMLPAVGQGTLAVETRADDAGTRRLAGALDHPATRAAADAERAFLAGVGGTCATPIAAHATVKAGTLRLAAMVASPDGAQMLRHAATGPLARAQALGREVAEWMLARGAGALVRQGQGVEP